jgi:hypothetical protein
MASVGWPLPKPRDRPESLLWSGLLGGEAHEATVAASASVELRRAVRIAAKLAMISPAPAAGAAWQEGCLFLLAVPVVSHGRHRRLHHAVAGRWFPPMLSRWLPGGRRRPRAGPGTSPAQEPMIPWQADDATPHHDPAARTRHRRSAFQAQSATEHE